VLGLNHGVPLMCANCRPNAGGLSMDP
jgi:hypothetical protein